MGSRDHLPHIDALRGIAALIVALGYHQYYLLGRFHSGPFEGIATLDWVYDYGYTMVDLFFVISGFVFTHVYFREARLTAGARDFAVARFARLYPLHLATLAAMALLLWFGTPAGTRWAINDPYHFALNLVMLQGVGAQETYNFNIPAWSISVEVLCYALFFVLARWGGRHLGPIALGIALLGLALTQFADLRVDLVARGLCGYFAGVALHQAGAGRARLAALMTLLALATFGLEADLQLGAVLSLSLWPIVLLASSHVAALRTAPFQWLGSRSYSIYLLNGPVFLGASILVFGGERVAKADMPLVLALGAAMLLLAAELSYTRIELPARIALRRWLAPRRSAKPATA